MLFLDGIMKVLVDFTDYGALVLSPSPTSSCPALGLVTSILLAVPLELARGRYLAQLAVWVAGFPLESDDDTPPSRAALQQQQQQQQRTRQEEEEKQNRRWLTLFTSQVERFLGRRRQSSWPRRAPEQGGCGGGGGGGGGAGGRSLCLLGLVLSEGFALREDRDQVSGTTTPRCCRCCIRKATHLTANK